MKMTMFRSDNIPAELKALSQWVCWKGETGDNGKLRKIPINPRTGGGAMSNNPDTWSDFETAAQAAAQYDGVGFMFAPPYFGVDIDNVSSEIEGFKAGEDNNIVSEFVHTLGSYTEYSQSGNGIHIICRGTLPPSGRRRGNVEMYQDGRYFIMTGNNAADYTEIVECTEQIKPLHEKYIGGGREPTTGIRITPVSMTDREVLDAAFASKQGGIFRSLYDGQFEAYFGSHSEADMSFCNMLAFWSRCDEEMMDRIFRSSGLMREKWDRRQSGSTYGKLTIAKAVKGCRRVYEPKPEYGISIGRAKAKREYTLDDMGNAARLTDAFSERIRYSYVDKCWYFYDERRWKRDDSGVVERLSDEIVEEMKHGLKDYLNQPGDQEDLEKQYMKHLKYSRSNKGKKSMMAETMHHVPITPSQFDSHNQLLCTPNGIVHLRTGKLTAHDPELYLTRMTLCEYTDHMDCPRWKNFLEEIFNGDRALIRYIQKAVGYSLTGSTVEQCAFFCFGYGRNGKSTFLDIIHAMMGDYAVNIQPETIMVKHNSGNSASSDIARLKGARFVTSVEPNEGMRLNEGLLKQLTGGDKVTARFQYGQEFEFKPEFKLWMGTNYKPIIRGTDTGIWRRIHLIPFQVQIPDDKVDKHLELHLRSELPGILHWAIEGCRMWQKEGLEKPPVMQDALKEYRGEMDVVLAFLSACCTMGEGREKTSDLYQAYNKWASENNEYVMSSRKFGTEMAKRFERTKSNGVYYYDGLTLQYGKPYQITIGSA